MKILKRLIIVFAVLLISVAVFVIANISYSKYVLYPKWVEEYLQSRYTENMVIQKIRFSDMGWLAAVSPENDLNIQFSVKGKYIDTYLERNLEYQTEQALEEKYPEYSCQAQMLGYESIDAPFPELYQLYMEKGAPPKWEDVPDHIRLERLRIDTNCEIGDKDKQDILNTIYDRDVRTSIVEIYDGNEMYTFKYDMSSGMYIEYE